jgi:hypothetical protein
MAIQEYSKKIKISEWSAHSARFEECCSSLLSAAVDSFMVVSLHFHCAPLQGNYRQAVLALSD